MVRVDSRLEVTMEKGKALKRLRQEAERLGFDLSGVAIVRRTLRPVVLSRKDNRKLCIALADGGYYVVKYSEKGLRVRSLEGFRALQRNAFKAREALSARRAVGPAD